MLSCDCSITNESSCTSFLSFSKHHWEYCVDLLTHQIAMCNGLSSCQSFWQLMLYESRYISMRDQLILIDFMKRQWNGLDSPELASII